MNIFLLTHQRERFKRTNTGGLVNDVLGDKARILIWERTTPDPELLCAIDEGSIALLYPSINSQFTADSPKYQNYIIIDGTWQEARKIYNKSPYLKNIPAIKITATSPSLYNLRRNQKEGGLCTAECAVELLKANGFSQQAEDLYSAFLNRIGS